MASWRVIRHDGNRYLIWGGRPRGQGMPAFPRGRSAPAFPRIGPAAQVKDPLLDPRQQPAVLVRPLDRAGARRPGRPRRPAGPAAARAAGPRRRACTRSRPRAAARCSRSRRARSSSARPPDEMAAGRNLLTCTVCRDRSSRAPPRSSTSSTARRACWCAAPARCAASRGTDNYYRRLYASADMRRIVAREHTGLIDDATRLRYETEFKQSASDPDAPNVLVATPTLEMGIDIGDLSAVLLASLPKTVASYLQRVGRAGRLTGSALDLAFVTGRGEQLPRLEDPLSVINGQVRAPATYLSAEEILRRQYVAHLVDCFARDETGRTRGRARGALGSADAGTLPRRADPVRRGRGRRHLDRFLGSFDGPGRAPVAEPARLGHPGRRRAGQQRPGRAPVRRVAALGGRRSRASRTGGPRSRRRCPSSSSIADASPAASDDDQPRRCAPPARR